MKTTTLTCLFTPALIALSASAANVMTISGKLISITPSHYVVESQGATVTIKKDRIPAAMAETLTKTETPVTISVRMEDIERIKPIEGALKPQKR